jgi:hypothetical protein
LEEPFVCLDSQETGGDAVRTASTPHSSVGPGLVPPMAGLTPSPDPGPVVVVKDPPATVVPASPSGHEVMEIDPAPSASAQEPPTPPTALEQMLANLAMGLPQPLCHHSNLLSFKSRCLFGLGNHGLSFFYLVSEPTSLSTLCRLYSSWSSVHIFFGTVYLFFRLRKGSELAHSRPSAPGPFWLGKPPHQRARNLLCPRPSAACPWRISLWPCVSFSSSEKLGTGVTFDPPPLVQLMVIGASFLAWFCAHV